jgi:hypothetical protein
MRLIMRNILLFMFVFCPLISNSQVPPKVSFIINSGIENGKKKQIIESNTSKLLLKLNEAFIKQDTLPQFDNKIFSPNGLQTVLDLWKDENFYCPVNKISENLLNRKDSYQVRNIPIVFGKTDTVDVVIGYLPDGRIDDFYFGLDSVQYKSALDKNAVIDQPRVLDILQFLEILKKYYMEKDIINIEKLYSDKALIITGKLLQTLNVPMDQSTTYVKENQVRYQVLTKGEYIARLLKVFRNTSYLRLDYNNIEIVKHRKHPDFYGVQFQQTWNSSNYKDEGWLFLLVQFRENKDPLIWVRTWNIKEFGLWDIKIQNDGIVTN